MNLLLFFYDLSQAAQMLRIVRSRAKKQRFSVVVFNPDSGPSSGANQQAWREQIDKLREAGGHFVDFVAYLDLADKRGKPQSLGLLTLQLDTYVLKFNVKRFWLDDAIEGDPSKDDKHQPKSGQGPFEKLLQNLCDARPAAHWSVSFANPGCPVGKNHPSFGRLCLCDWEDALSGYPGRTRGNTAVFFVSSPEFAAAAKSRAEKDLCGYIGFEDLANKGRSEYQCHFPGWLESFLLSV